MRQRRFDNIEARLRKCSHAEIDKIVRYTGMPKKEAEFIRTRFVFDSPYIGKSITETMRLYNSAMARIAAVLGW